MDAAIRDTLVVILTHQRPHCHSKNGSITLKIEANLLLRTPKWLWAPAVPSALTTVSIRHSSGTYQGCEILQHKGSRNPCFRPCMVSECCALSVSMGPHVKQGKYYRTKYRS